MIKIMLCFCRWWFEDKKKRFFCGRKKSETKNDWHLPPLSTTEKNYIYIRIFFCHIICKLMGGQFFSFSVSPHS